MAMENRPLSPHLQIYKPQLTSVLSIMHRGAGVFLTAGALFLSCWLLALAGGPEQFETLQAHVTSWYGQCILCAFVFALYYHLCNGIRHLLWDTGTGFEINTAYKTGYVMLASSIILTLLTLYVALGGAA